MLASKGDKVFSVVRVIVYCSTSSIPTSLARRARPQRYPGGTQRHVLDRSTTPAGTTPTESRFDLCPIHSKISAGNQIRHCDMTDRPDHSVGQLPTLDGRAPCAIPSKIMKKYSPAPLYSISSAARSSSHPFALQGTDTSKPTQS